MEYYDDRSLETGFPRQYQCRDDIGAEVPAYVENAVAVARDGSCLYDVSEVATADNGDMIATVSDTNADDTVPFSFIKYVCAISHHTSSV